MRNFYTDVIQKSPKFRSIEAVRDLDLLEPVTRAAAQGIIAAAAKKGLTLISLETYRSTERQQNLFRKGATQLRAVGVHHFGLAFDLGLIKAGHYDPDGRDYLFLRELAEDHGMIWGGDWGTPNAPHNFRDYDHCQRCSITRQSDLLAGRWYPDAAYNPLADYGRAPPKAKLA